ncbi:rna polymerase ii transcription [Lentinula edodes]|uniref:Rna polymerase ii transcription n=1 Tax=Lentinula edodes TaxID=5353 RepID=A0A1Q3E9D8_LENED|nr:rna polymerase ii transcription [Lentinula edodes]
MESNVNNNPVDSPEANPDTKMAVTSATKRSRPTPSKTFQCRNYGDCRMVFSRSEHLARHIRKHTGERPFTCHCGKNFSRLDNLRQHAQTVHADKADQNERMMRELGRVHATMAAANKQAAQAAGVPARSSRGSQDSTSNSARPGRSRARPGTSTGYEGAGGADAIYPGLAMPANQLNLTGYPDLPDPYLVRKKEQREDGSIDSENGNTGSYSRTENTSNGGYNRFHPHLHHPYNSYPYNSYNSIASSSTTAYPNRSTSTSTHGYNGAPTASSPSLSSSSSPSPVQDIESSPSFNTAGGNFPYDHISHLQLGSASASAPYLPLAGIPMTQSPVSEMPPPMTIELSGPGGRTVSSRTSHPHLQHLHIQPQHHQHPSHPGSPFQSPPLSASHSGSSASGSGSGGYFPLVPVDSNERHRSSHHHHHQQQSTSVPNSPFEATYQNGSGGMNGYVHAYSQQPQRVTNQGYSSSGAWAAQGTVPSAGGGAPVGGYWA